MKKYIIMLWATIASTVVVSCNRDSEPEIKTDTSNQVTLKFENKFKDQAMIGLTGTYTSNSGQKHQFSALKYIISDVILVKTDGAEVKYHYADPDNGAYIVDQEEPTSTHNFILNKIPSGDYKAIKFGLGISPQAYILGQDKQAKFWDKAKKSGMDWSWGSGYKFVKFEGTYGNILDQYFKIHIGNIGDPSVSNTPNVYKTVSLALPQVTKVRGNIAPKIHIFADINQFLSGLHNISLDNSNAQGMHPAKDIVRQTAENLSQMFSVDHVHND